jgi:hypothetical protein
MTCVVCNRRPAVKGGYCKNCLQKIEADKKLRGNGEAVKYVTYQGHVVGFYRNGGSNLIPRLLQRKPEGLPKGRTLDLNSYIPGFTREQIKKLKACIFQLAEV